MIGMRNWSSIPRVETKLLPCSHNLRACRTAILVRSKRYSTVLTLICRIADLCIQPISSGSKAERIWRTRDWASARHRCYRISADGKGITDCARPGKRRRSSILSQLLEIERSDDLILVPDTGHEQINPLARRRYDIHNNGQKQRILTRGYFPRRWRHDSIYVALLLSRFILVLFGLKNGPGTLQRAIEVLLTEIRWQFALVY